jgi:hypothetical protein
MGLLDGKLEIATFTDDYVQSTPSPRRV